MDDLLLSASSRESVNNYLKNPRQSIALIGSKWIGKEKIAGYIVSKILDINQDQLINYPYYYKLTSSDNKAIGIEEVRKLVPILSLKVPSNKDISRIILISDSELMTIEAQNAILKDLEDPPSATLFIISASSINSLLPTIISRLAVIQLQPLNKDGLIKYFTKSSSLKDAESAYSMSGSQPELMRIILNSEDNPLSNAAQIAKEMLTGSKLERVNLINDLAKDKNQLTNFFYIIKEMAKIGVKSSNQKSAIRWRNILSSALKSETLLKSSTQVKLTLTDFVLSIN